MIRATQIGQRYTGSRFWYWAFKYRYITIHHSWFFLTQPKPFPESFSKHTHRLSTGSIIIYNFAQSAHLLAHIIVWGLWLYHLTNPPSILKLLNRTQNNFTIRHVSMPCARITELLVPAELRLQVGSSLSEHQVCEMLILGRTWLQTR